MNFFRFFSFAGFLLSALVAEAYTPTEDGLYAQFDTSAGEFTCKLHYEKVPLTVANFVGLAEGTQDWYDYEEKVIKKDEPFYDGVTFHRIVANTFVQTGSRNGEGTDDPGYAFADELDSSLMHSTSGILSMANRAAPNSNGSQFFITLVPLSHLNYNHAVFGKVVDGLSVVATISNGEVSETDDDAPVEPFVINHISIIRIGEDAQNFDPKDYPTENVVSLSPEDFTTEEEAQRYVFSTDEILHLPWAFESDDLQTWNDVLPENASIAYPNTFKITVSDEQMENKSHFFKVFAQTGFDLNAFAGKHYKFTFNGATEPGWAFGLMDDGVMRINPDYGGGLGQYRMSPFSDSRSQLWVSHPPIPDDVNPFPGFNLQFYLTLNEGSETEGTFFMINLFNVINPIIYQNYGTFTVSDYSEEEE